jgi:Zn ribbon nucleic-acid-binding protein
LGEAPEGSGERGELEEFRRALIRFRRLSGMNVDIDTAVSVEELELKLASRVATEAREAVKAGADLNSFASELWEKGVVNELYREASRFLGIEAGDPSGALAKLLESDYEDPRAQAMFLTLQSIARAYSSALLRVDGVKTKLTHVCPVCGVESDIMAYEGKGQYVMVCPFCYYKWRLPGEGLVCPRCGSRDKFALGLYMDRRDSRVALLHCQNCGYTVKLIRDPEVTRASPRSVLPLIAMGASRLRHLIEED